MSDTQQPEGRPTEPTLAEFREHLVDMTDAVGESRDGMLVKSFIRSQLRNIIGRIDDYTSERDEFAVADDSGEGWGDSLSRENLRSVARAHRSATRREELGDLERLLDDLADEFTLADVRIIRMVAAALADAMPRMAHKAREQGMTPDEIAQQSGYTTSRITQFIRQEKERRAERDAQ
ncbi:hypothetical protein [Streptomyces sp. NPDC058621]|uniref:hypothetical protein n=1 Tax=Streptomyces sp. NPDC058621 TaxID=3346561 RepID=UPI00366A4F89